MRQSITAAEKWATSFRIYLSGTEVPFLARLDVLGKKLDKLGDEAIQLVTVALDSALNEYGVWFEGAPIAAGDVRPADWRPGTYGELWACLDGAMAMLRRYLSNDTHGDKVFQVIVRHGRGLLQNGRGQQLKAIVESIELNEQQRVAVLDFVGDFLEYDSKGIDCSTSPERDYLKSVEDWHTSLQRHDLSGRLLESLSVSASRGRFENAQDWKNRIQSLAAQLFMVPDLLARLLDSLVGGAHHPGALMVLGISIGRLDMPASLLKLVIASARNAKSPNFIRGYLFGLAEQGPIHDNAVTVELDSLEEARPDLAVDLNEMNTRLGSAGVRALRLVRAGRLPTEFLTKVGPVRFQGELLAETLETILDSLAEEPQEAARVALELLSGPIWEEQEELPGDDRCVDAMWRILEAGSRDAGGQANTWGRLLRRMSHHNLETAIRLACNSAASGGYFVKEEATKELAFHVEANPALVLTCLGPLLLEPRTSWSLAIGHRASYVNDLPMDSVIPWLDEHGVDGARAIAMHLTPPSIDEGGNPVVPRLTEYILDKFEYDEKVFSNFCMTGRNGKFYSGDIAGQHDKEAVVAMKFCTHRLRRVREWADHESRSARWGAKFWRQREEEDSNE